MSTSKWWRIIPVAFVMYMLAYIDRLNISILMPYIEKDLGLTATSSGEIAGIFFIGYMILQIPAGILASKWSAKKVVLILMIAWGVAATASGFVQTEGQLKVARFLLGVAEGGVWPAVIILLANWFTTKERARANAFWMTCTAVSAIIMAPLTGFLLKYFSWKTVLVIEGIPPLLWAIIWHIIIQDKPQEAKWMETEEQNALIKELEFEKSQQSKQLGYRAAFKNPLVWGLVVMYYFWMTGFYGYILWLPTVIGSFTKNSITLGFLTAIPFICALVGMIINSYWSDKRMNRVQHVAFPLILAALSMVIGQYVDSNILQMVLLCTTAIGVYAPNGPLWAIPTAVIPASIVGAAIGLQNALGNLGGYYGPKFFGVLKDATGNFQVGFFFLAGSLLVSAMITLVLGKFMKKENTASVNRPANNVTLTR
jgi:sugar phosphate permease